MCSQDARVGTIRFGFSEDVLISGNIVYVSDQFDGVSVYDVSDPGDFRLLAELGSVGTHKLQLSGGTLFAQSYAGQSILVFDVTDPAGPVLLTEVTLPDGEFPRAFAVGDDRMYLGRESLIYEYDITDPSMPVVTDSFESPLYLWFADMRVVDGELLCESSSSIYLIDTDPSGATHGEPRRISDGRSFESYEYSDGLLYLSSRYRGVSVLDTRVEGDPVQLYQDGDGRSHGIELVGDTLYVASYSDGIRMLDVQDPTAPRLLGYVDPGMPVSDVQIDGGRMYAYEWTSHTPDPFEGHIIDLAATRLASQRGALDLARAGGRVAVDGGIAYVAQEERIHAVDVMDP
ncbi:MAG: LVIVD repeat-containing protein, partial [Phycisphaerales bacterium]